MIEGNFYADFLFVMIPMVIAIIAIALIAIAMILNNIYKSNKELTDAIYRLVEVTKSKK